MSKLIIISEEIEESINKIGFHPVPSKSFCINAELNYDTIKFINAYENLEIDMYFLNKTGYPSRKRKYGSFFLDTKKDILTANKHCNFLQSSKVNSLFGDIERNFAPLDSEILKNKFLHELIKADFKKFPDKDKILSKKWFIGVHMFRIEATNNYIGLPTPEGIHQDEHHFVVQHMIRKENAKGGISTIYTLDKKEITSLTFNNFLDTCYVKDDKVMHGVTNIECIDIDKTAIRDMLILDFETIN